MYEKRRLYWQRLQSRVESQKWSGLDRVIIVGVIGFCIIFHSMFHNDHKYIIQKV